MLLLLVTALLFSLHQPIQMLASAEALGQKTGKRRQSFSQVVMQTKRFLNGSTWA